MTLHSNIWLETLNFESQLKRQSVHKLRSRQRVGYSICFSSNMKDPEIVISLQQNIDGCFNNAVVIWQGS